MSDKSGTAFPEICQPENSSTTFFYNWQEKKGTLLWKMSRQQLMTDLHFASTSDNTAAADHGIPRKWVKSSCTVTHGMRRTLAGNLERTFFSSLHGVHVCRRRRWRRLPLTRLATWKFFKSGTCVYLTDLWRKLGGQKLTRSSSEPRINTFVVSTRWLSTFTWLTRRPNVAKINAEFLCSKVYSLNHPSKGHLIELILSYWGCHCDNKPHYQSLWVFYVLGKYTANIGTAAFWCPKRHCDV